MSGSAKTDRAVRDVVIRFDDPQIKEVLVQVDRKDGAPIVYANLSKFSRLGVDFVLDLIQIDPAELQLAIQAAREAAEKPAQLNMEGKVIARVLMGPILVKNVREQADQILQGVEVKQPRIGDNADADSGSLTSSPPKLVH